MRISIPIYSFIHSFHLFIYSMRMREPLISFIITADDITCCEFFIPQTNLIIIIIRDVWNHGH